jgi:phosphatidylserine/phosphatidylglycerophosphate/cardiolipin synthase-like enzyme
MLLAASQAVEAERQSEIVDLVWTGPRTLSVPLRHTEQALLEVIRSAQRTLLIVSFAVYRAQTVKQALLQAAHRDVRVEICIEASERGSTHTGYDTTAALGADLLAATSVYVWPQAERITTEAGQTGSLHAKCAVADKDSLFVSSANLTDYAMNLNMELGVLIRGGNLPGQVRDQFTRLIENRILVPWSG